jgi:hypothetical protein
MLLSFSACGKWSSHVNITGGASTEQSGSYTLLEQQRNLMPLELNNINTLRILFDLPIYVNGEKKMEDAVESKTDLDCVNVLD